LYKNLIVIAAGGLPALVAASTAYSAFSVYMKIKREEAYRESDRYHFEKTQPPRTNVVKQWPHGQPSKEGTI
jgi:hypothetical protein